VFSLLNKLAEGTRRLLLILTWCPVAIFSSFHIYVFADVIITKDISRFLSITADEMFSWELYFIYLFTPIFHYLINWIFQVNNKE